MRLRAMARAVEGSALADTSPPGVHTIAQPDLLAGFGDPGDQCGPAGGAPASGGSRSNRSASCQSRSSW